MELSPGPTPEATDGDDATMAPVSLVDGYIVSEVLPESMDADGRDQYGWAVAVNHGVMVVGARSDEAAEGDVPGAGSVYAYRWAGGQYHQVSKLRVDAGNAQFGFAVATYGGRIIATAPGAEDDLGRRGVGAAFVYAWDETTYTLVDEVRASDGQADDDFGDSVAMDDDRLILGATATDDRGPQSGSAYVYEWTGTRYEEITKLTGWDDDGGPNSRFGNAVAIFHDTVAVGANQLFGAVFVWAWDGTRYVQRQKLIPSTRDISDYFGISLALSDDDTIIVGSTLYESERGAVYVFKKMNGLYTEAAMLTADDGSSGDAFGTSVAVDGGTIVVGAPGDDFAVDDPGYGYFPSGENPGSVYIFTESMEDGGYVETSKLTAIEPHTGDSFGNGIAIDANDGTIVCGAPLDNSNVGGDAGAVYVFIPTQPSPTLDPSAPTWYPTPVPTSLDVAMLAGTLTVDGVTLLEVKDNTAAVERAIALPTSVLPDAVRVTRATEVTTRRRLATTVDISFLITTSSLRYPDVNRLLNSITTDDIQNGIIAEAIIEVPPADLSTISVLSIDILSTPVPTITPTDPSSAPTLLPVPPTAIPTTANTPSSAPTAIPPTAIPTTAKTPSSVPTAIPPTLTASSTPTFATALPTSE